MKTSNESDNSKFSQEIGNKASRKLRAIKSRRHHAWFGFATFGLIGWSVALPTLLGAVLGLWLDRRYPGGRSWTLSLLVAGLTLGCFNAWRWISTENKKIKKDQEENKNGN